MRRIATLLLILCPLLIYGQSANKDRDKNQDKMSSFLNKINDEDKKEKKVTEPSSITKEGPVIRDSISKRIVAKKFPDISNYYSECYTNVVNQYGFWKGIGRPLTKEQMRHVNTYYRLLRPVGSSASAPFTHMQIINSFGKLATNRSYGPHLANPFGNDDGISDLWRYKLETICQSEKISHDGILVQENMYDADGNLVLQYFPISVSKNHIIGHYTDAYGATALLRKDEECKCISIKLDENGYESEIAFVNEKGQFRRNNDDAFIKLFKKDKDGNVLYQMSADALGRPIIDKYGNCGWRYTYDRNGRIEKGSCINQYGIPMRMPQKQPNEDNVWNVKYTYDKWGNMVSQSFFDDKWEPDTAFNGVHRYIYAYNDRGLQTLCRAEGLHGELANFREDLAVWENLFDENGNLIFSESRNKDSLFCSNGDCLSIYRYMDGNQVLRLDYNTTNGNDTILNYKKVSSNSCDTVWNYIGNYINVTLYDNKGRTKENVYYDLSMNPINDSGVHKIEHEYLESCTQSVHTECITNSIGMLADVSVKGYWRKYNIEVTEIDSVKRIQTISRFNGNSLLDKYSFEYDEDFSSSCGLLYYDSIGYRGRSFKADALYYKAVPKRSVQGNITSWSGVNEFGEPSYILNGDWDNATLYCTDVVSDSYYYDEKGDTIPRYAEARREFKDSLYKSFCIELTDPVAIQHGLRTGDIIVRYGDWQYPVPSTNGRYYESLLALEAARKALDTKTMVVMRHDEATKTSRLIELQMPEGTPKELGFIYHMLYMTKKETTRYKDVVETQRPDVRLDAVNTDKDGNENVRFVMPYKVGDASDKRMFMRGFQENAIVIAWEPHVGGTSYLFPCNSALYGHALTNECDSVILHYTVDCKNVKRVVLQDDDFIYVHRSNISIDDASDIYALADSLQKEFDMLHPRERIVLSPHVAAERLLQLPGSIEDSDDGEDYQGDDKYGNVNSSRWITVDNNSLDYEQMFLVQNILKNIDFSNYWFIGNGDCNGYFFENKGVFSECIWKNRGGGLTFLSGSVNILHKQTMVAEVVEEGLFNEYGLDGKYVILRCNNWYFGKGELLELKKEISSDGLREFVLAKIVESKGQIILGRIQRFTFPIGKLGIQLAWEDISDEVFRDALNKIKRLKRSK